MGTTPSFGGSTVLPENSMGDSLQKRWPLDARAPPQLVHGIQADDSLVSSGQASAGCAEVKAAG